MTMIDKRTVKRVLAGLTAAASLATGGIMAGTAMAADVTVTPNTGKDSPDTTITLQASVDTAFKNGDKFDKTKYLKAIQLATYNSGTATAATGGNLTGIDVTTNDDWKDAINAALGKTGADAEENPIVDVMKMTGDVKGGKPAYASDLRNFVTKFTTVNKDKLASATGSGTGAIDTDPKLFKFTGLTPGYYLIIDSSPKGMSAAVPMLVGTKLAGMSFAEPASELGVVYYKSIDDDTTGGGQTTPDPDKPDKNNPNVKPPEKTKNDGEDDVTVHKTGDIIKYTVSQTVPNTTGYPGYRLELGDTLGAALKYYNDAEDTAHQPTVTITNDKGADKTLDVKYYNFAQDTKNPNKLTWQFGLPDNEDPYPYGDVNGDGNTDANDVIRNILKDDATAALFAVGRTIKVTYYAQIQSTHQTEDGALSNNVGVDYSNNPNAWWNQLNHKDGGVPDKPGTPVTALTGEVKLTAVDNDKAALKSDTTYHFFTGADTTALQFVKEGEDYVLANTGDTGTTPDIVVPAGKTITVKGIQGDYHVSETVHPAGFSTSIYPDFKFNAAAEKDAAGTVTLKATLTSTAAGGDNLGGLAYQDEAKLGKTGIGMMHITNVAQLPATGSTLTVILGVMSAIVAAGFAVAYTKSRQRA